METCDLGFLEPENLGALQATLECCNPGALEPGGFWLFASLEPAPLGTFKLYLNLCSLAFWGWKKLRVLEVWDSRVMELGNPKLALFQPYKAVLPCLESESLVKNIELCTLWNCRVDALLWIIPCCLEFTEAALLCFAFALHCAGHFIVDIWSQDPYKSRILMLGTLNPGNLEPHGNLELNSESVGFQSLVTGRCTPRKTMKNWKSPGTLLEPSWNRACWNLPGALLEPFWNGACWNLPGALLEPFWNGAGASKMHAPENRAGHQKAGRPMNWETRAHPQSWTHQPDIGRQVKADIRRAGHNQPDREANKSRHSESQTLPARPGDK